MVFISLLRGFFILGIIHTCFMKTDDNFSVSSSTTTLITTPHTTSSLDYNTTTDITTPHITLSLDYNTTTDIIIQKTTLSIESPTSSDITNPQTTLSVGNNTTTDITIPQTSLSGVNNTTTDITTPQTTSYVDNTTIDLTTEQTTTLSVHNTTTDITTEQTTLSIDNTTIDITTEQTTLSKDNTTIDITTPHTTLSVDNTTTDITTEQTTLSIDKTTIDITTEQTTLSIDKTTIDITTPQTTSYVDNTTIDITTPHTTLSVDNTTTDNTTTQTALSVDNTTTDITTTQTTLSVDNKTTDITTPHNTLSVDNTTTDITTEQTTLSIDNTTTDITTPQTTLSVVNNTTTNTNSLQNTGSTQPNPTTPHNEASCPSCYPVPAFNASVELRVKFTNVTWLVFNESLLNKASLYYQNTSDYVIKELEPIFRNVTGFQNIAINSFWNGSVGVNFTALVHVASTPQLRKDLTSVRQNLMSSTVDPSYLQQVFANDKDNALAQVLRVCNTVCCGGYSCQELGENTMCQPSCRDHTACLNGGQCVLNEDFLPVCRCQSDSENVYSGDQCQVRTEKFAIGKDSIIGIAAGVGGGVILILIIVIIVLVSRGRFGGAGRKVLDNASDQSFKSFRGSEEVINQPAASRYQHHYLDIENNMYRLSEERAENPHFNPYLIQYNSGARATEEIDFSQGFPPIGGDRGARARDQNRKSSLTGRPQSGVRGQEVENNSSDHRNQVTSELKNKLHKMFKSNQSVASNQVPINALQQHRLVDIYDYTRRPESATQERPRPTNDTQLYDFGPEVGGAGRGLVPSDPYSVKRPLVSTQHKY